MPANVEVLPVKGTGEDGFKDGINQIQRELVLEMAIGQVAVITVQVAKGSRLNDHQIEWAKGRPVRC